MKEVKVTPMKLTKSMENFLYNDVLPHYILYNRKDKYAFCTSCQKEVDIDFTNTKPKMIITCPSCKREAYLKSSGQTKNSFSDSGVGIMLDKDNGNVCVRYFDVRKIYTKEGLLKDYWNHECLREYFYTDGNVISYDNTAYYGWRKCNLRKYDNYKGRAGEPCYHINTNWKIRKNYTKNIARVIKGTHWEHSCMDKIFKLKDTHHYWDVMRWFLKDYLKAPTFEYLYKVGFYNILQRGVFVQTLKLDTTKSSLPDILMVSKPMYKAMLDIGNPTYEDLNDYQDMTRFGIKTKEDCAIWRKYFGSSKKESSYDWWTYHHKDPAEEFRKYYHKSWKKLDDYAKTIPNFNIRTYEDYLKMSGELAYDLTNSFVLFPKNLIQAHEDVTMEWNFKFNPKEFEKAKKRNVDYDNLKEKYKKKYEFAKDNLQIVVPDRCEEICIEGQVLHHCVGTYINRVAQGISTILFVRNITQLATSYYTMEVADGKIVQCRGYRNCSVTPEVREFISAFAKKKHLLMNSIS